MLFLRGKGRPGVAEMARYDVGMTRVRSVGRNSRNGWGWGGGGSGIGVGVPWAVLNSSNLAVSS